MQTIVHAQFAAIEPEVEGFRTSTTAGRRRIVFVAELDNHDSGIGVFIQIIGEIVGL